MVLLSIYFGVTFLAYCTYIYAWYVSPRPVISPPFRSTVLLTLASFNPYYHFQNSRLMAKKRSKRIIAADGTESALERQFQSLWLNRYPQCRPSTQVRFHPTRKWVFDFAWPVSRVAVEVQGMGPGHCSLMGMTRDYDKMRAAILLNWKVIYLTSKHLHPSKIDSTCNDIALLLGIPVTTSKHYIPLSQRK